MKTLGKPVEDAILAEAREDGDPNKCRHGKYLWCEECNTAAYKTGQDAGAETATLTVAKVLGEMAAKLFLDGHDEKARGVRELLNKINTALQELTKKGKRT